MSRALRPAKYVWDYLKEVSGENAYDRYLERHYATHPEKEPLKRGEFYRWRQEALYSNPGSRCP
jgi:uncharacterized short protein YbdD (DUF466 family)